MLQVNFELEGYDVVAAPDGPTAINAAEKEGVDIVVCDRMMPGMDGLEVVRRLRENPKTAGIPIVIVSAKAQRSDLAEGEEAGVDEYVTKPFDPQDLLDTVAKVLKRK